MKLAEQLSPPIAIFLGLFIGWTVFAPEPAPIPEAPVMAPCDVAELQADVRALEIDVRLLEAEKSDGGWP